MASVFVCRSVKIKHGGISPTLTDTGIGALAKCCGASNSHKTPPLLLRAFKERDHARSFIEGHIRFGLLEGYRTIEGLRRDETEGKMSVCWNLPNPVHCDRSSMNPHYILCTSHPEANRSLLIERFGPHIVRINDPITLLKRIRVVWEQRPLAAGRCVIEPVVYNKDTLLEPISGLLPPVEYSYSQKPKFDPQGLDFEEEREFRYVLTCTADQVKLNTLADSEGRPRGVLNDHFFLKLPDCSDICSLT